MYFKRFCVVAVAAVVLAVATQGGVGWAAGTVTAELVDRTNNSTPQKWNWSST